MGHPKKMTDAHEKLTSAIKSGETPSLKHVETVDKAAPKIEPDVQVKKVDRSGFLDEVKSAAEKELKHVETVDKAAPAIPADAHVGENKHKDLLAEIAKKAE